MSHYAQVILPLPLRQTFTYRLTDDMATRAAVGMRVVVQFGVRHFYTGIIAGIADVSPVTGDLKDIEELLDDVPLVLPSQLSLWAWMADYYLCSVGEVMKAALPSGLKLESETTVRRNVDYEESPDCKLTEAEVELLARLGDKPISVAALEKFTGRQKLLPAVRRLVEKEAVFIDEAVERRYKPKLRTCVRLGADYNPPAAAVRSDDDPLHRAFDLLRRSPRQQALLVKWLDMSGHLRRDADDAVVPRDALLKGASAAPAVLGEMVRRGIFELYQVPADSLSVADGTSPVAAARDVPAAASPLTEVQGVAYRAVCQSWHDHRTTLLHGVTSSGKTEIYIHLMLDVIRGGRQALLMVPEIALTTQLCTRLRRVFGSRMVVYHSRLSDGERVDIWRRMLSDTAPDVVLGVRSSVFLPFRQLGLVVVDEEHEPSYKQQDPAPRYHGRDVAIVVAQRHEARVLLGSATPAVETYWLAERGKYGLVTLGERHAGVEMPQIRLVATRGVSHQAPMAGPFTPALLQSVGRAVQSGRQAILFQNRRGYAPVIECPSCGWTPHCPRCDVALTWHRGRRRLECHYCGYAQPWPARCPSCGGVRFEEQGYGTERIEDVLRHALPTARVARMDTDTTSTRRSHERLLADFESGRANVLVGTQMVSKGLDFDSVQTVGVMNADALMQKPDFRAHERAFQLMEQVAGRAGRRAGQVGEVIVQCGNPRTPLLEQVARHDYAAMYADQLADRRRYAYPPFTRLIAVYMKGRYDDRLDRLAAHYAEALRAVFGSRVLGPEAPAVARVKNMYIRKVLLKVEREASPAEVRRCLLAVEGQALSTTDSPRVVFYYDVDPM